ncbi:hypothetical protein KKJ04_19790 [Xenorhabdus bovienii]|uniref:hypothetical protein n=1 Tax=Xenorhabdus bovienii TaxID=40576 RepID=UPI0023B32345|nr:hypothetical protein [Xenorhabdus bovienii]MDE9447744.1 hypothetical protein [Xenorhabdus bovienii]
MTKQFDGVISNFVMTTDASSKEQMAYEVSALKLAVALIYRRMPKEDQENLLIEMRQLNEPSLNKVADELQQFQIE